METFEDLTSMSTNKINNNFKSFRLLSNCSIEESVQDQIISIAKMKTSKSCQILLKKRGAAAKKLHGQAHETKWALHQQHLSSPRPPPFPMETWTMTCVPLLCAMVAWNPTIPSDNVHNISQLEDIWLARFPSCAARSKRLAKQFPKVTSQF